MSTSFSFFDRLVAESAQVTTPIVVDVNEEADVKSQLGNTDQGQRSQNKSVNVNQAADQNEIELISNENDKSGVTAVATGKLQDEQEKIEKTVFVGNVPVEAVKSKKLQKSLAALFAEHGTVESMRFRSIVCSTMS